MKKFFVILSTVLAALVIIFAFPFANKNSKTNVSQHTALQQIEISILPLDFGNSNDFGGGGGSNHSGGSSWSGGSGGGSSHSSDSSGDDNPIFLVAIVIFVMIPVLAFFIKLGWSTYKDMRNEKSIIQQTAGRNVVLLNRNDRISALIRENDPNFLTVDFTQFAKKVYINIQYAWSSRNLESVRVYLHDNLYNQTQKQIDEKIANGIVNVIKNVNVDTVYLTAYSRDREFEYATVYLKATLTDYEIDERTREIIRGNPNVMYELRYTLKFTRNLNVKTSVNNQLLHYCPNCGAPLEMSSSGKCKYCGSTITTGQYSWVLSEYSSIRNDTVDQGIYIEKDNNAQNDTNNK